jgi:ATP-dependent Zn protease
MRLVNVTHNPLYKSGENMNSETKLLFEKVIKLLLLGKAYSNENTILTSHSHELDAPADALMDHETLAESEIKTGN